MSQAIDNPARGMGRARCKCVWSLAGGALMLVLASLVAACGLIRLDTSLTKLVTSARVPVDHAVLAQSYRDRAQRLRAEAREHAALADWWSSLAEGSSPAAVRGRNEQAQHCQRLAANLIAAAEDAEELAEFHERLAQPSAEPRRHDDWRHQ